MSVSFHTISSAKYSMFHCLVLYVHIKELKTIFLTAFLLS
jgi:hypothetical protein